MTKRVMITPGTPPSLCGPHGERFQTLRLLIPTLYQLTPEAAIPALEAYLEAAGESIPKGAQ